MPSYTYGKGPWSVATDAAGNVQTGIHLTVWTSEAADTQITALKSLAGSALPSYVSTDAQGRYRFRIDVTTWPVVWMRDPAGNMWQEVAAEVLNLVPQAITNAATAAVAVTALTPDVEEATNKSNEADARSTQALDAAEAASDAAAAALASVGLGRSWDQATAPIYIAHRGGANLAPENSLMAFQALLSESAAVPAEVDCYRCTDGSTIIMHDTTVDRTTNGVGNCVDYTSYAAKRIRIDPSTWFAPGWTGDLSVPTLEDLMRELGGRALMLIEAKNAGAGQLIVDAATRHGVQTSVMLESFIQAELMPAVAAGMDSMFVSMSPGSVNWATIAAAGITWVGLNGATSGQIAAAHAAGLKVAAWTLDRQYLRDLYLGYGVDAIITNDPIWQRGGYRRTTDPFSSQSYYHGHLAGIPGAAVNWDRGYFTTPDWFTLDAYNTTDSREFVLQGWACPIKGDPAANAYTIALTMRQDNVESSIAWGSLFICAADDHPYSDSGTSVEPNGYHIVFRQSGVVDVFKIGAGGVATNIGTVTHSAWTTGTSRAFSVQVTATQIIVTSAGQTTLTVTDSTYRGGYFHLGVINAKVSFRAITVS